VVDAVTLYKDIYPSKEAYVFSTPLKNPFPWLNPAYKERTIKKGEFVRDGDRDEKYDEEE
jgi:hypothetical protein